MICGRFRDFDAELNFAEATAKWRRSDWIVEFGRIKRIFLDQGCCGR